MACSLVVAPGDRTDDAEAQRSGPALAVSIAQARREQPSWSGETGPADRRFRRLLEAAPDGILVVGQDGVIRLANPEAERLFGFEPGCLDGVSVDRLVPDAIRPRHAEYRAAYAQSPTTRPMGIGRRLVALRTDGTTFPAEISLSPVKDDGESLVIAVVRDVTDNRRIELERERLHAALETERARLAAVLEYLPVGVLFAETPDGRVSLGNSRAAAIVGADDITETTSGDRLASGASHGIDELGLAHVLASGEPIAPLRIGWVRDEDDRSIIETRAAPIFDSAGSLLGAVAVFEDVTDREAEVVARKEAEAALSREHALLDAVLTHLPDPVYVRDASGRYIRVNPAAAALLGLPEPVAATESFVDAVGAAQDDAVAFARAQEIMAAGEPATDLERLPGPEGDRWFLATRVPLRDADGSSAALLSVFRDVTRLKRAEEDMRRARDAAEAASAAAADANRTKSRFLSTMSHELRTPLTAILGYADLLLGGIDGDLTPQQADDVTKIAAGGQRLLCLVNDVLDLSRIEAGMMPLDLEMVDLTAVAQAVGEDVAPQASSRGLRLRVEVPADLPPVKADGRRVHQVLLNLVGNAVKFTEHGTVAVTAKAAGETVEIAVSDTGIGIAADVLPFVFDEFRQVDGSTTRRFEGSGLGLAITKRLVELHGGSIRVASTPGTGTTFTVSLPASALVAAAAIG